MARKEKKNEEYINDLVDERWKLFLRFEMSLHLQDEYAVVQVFELWINDLGGGHRQSER